VGILTSKVECFDVKQSGGPSVQPGDTVVIHYRVALSKEDIDAGNLLESTYAPDTPVEVEVTKQALLPGIYEGLIGMRAGGSIRLMILPPDLAYGCKRRLKSEALAFWS